VLSPQQRKTATEWISDYACTLANAPPTFPVAPDIKLENIAFDGVVPKFIDLNSFGPANSINDIGGGTFTAIALDEYWSFETPAVKYEYPDVLEALRKYLTFTACVVAVVQLNPELSAEAGDTLQALYNTATHEGVHPRRRAVQSLLKKLAEANAPGNWSETFTTLWKPIRALAHPQTAHFY
jgi:hypothetical protein